MFGTEKGGRKILRFSLFSKTFFDINLNNKCGLNFFEMTLNIKLGFAQLDFRTFQNLFITSQV
jgi:hypothetical protein